MDVALVACAEGGRRALPAVHVVGDPKLRETLAAALVAAGVDAVAADTPVAERGVIVAAPKGGDEVVRATFQAARTARLDAGGAFVVVTALGGDFGLGGLDEPVLTGLLGLTKTVAIEHPEAFVRVVDRGDASIDAVVAELGRTGPVEVALGSAGRRTLVPVMLPTSHTAPKLGPSDVIVVSGGARGVTAVCVVELAARTRARFILLGRSRIDGDEPPEARAAVDEPALMRALAPKAASPAALRKQVANLLGAREARATLAAIEAGGGQARYLPVDVTDTAAVAAALADVRAEWGPITGLVHGAGVIADSRLKQKTDAQWDLVWNTKILGVRALLAATADDPLHTLCFFASVAARTGNVGQADYAAANEVLNRLAAREARRRPGAVVKSIGWGPWEGGMVTPQLARAFHARGIALIPLLAGARAFVDELGSPGATEVVIGGLLAGDRDAPSLRRASGRDYPFLRDHSVGGAPVVPVVLALEWFAQRARELRPDRFVHSVERVSVLSGIVLKDFDGAGDLLAIHTTEVRDDGFAFELRAAGGRAHYRATVRMGDTPPAGPPRPAAGALATYPHDAATIYDRLLFHGPDFQVIRRVVGLSGEAAEAELRGAVPGWTQDAWVTDLASGDGGLQLAVLWSRQQLGGASLPTGVGVYRPYGRPAPGPVRGVLRGRQADAQRTLSDVLLIDGSGRVYAAFEGVELHRLPAGEYPGKAGEA
jgi:NAD(P)-dependent dehydrogenase (short-subunit alcohol dehydrogenase family)